jgi:hypothetical protein
MIESGFDFHCRACYNVTFHHWKFSAFYYFTLYVLCTKNDKPFLFLEKVKSRKFQSSGQGWIWRFKRVMIAAGKKAAILNDCHRELKKF